MTTQSRITPVGEQSWRSEFEPFLVELLDRKLARQGKRRYVPRNATEVAERLDAFLRAQGETRRARNVRRMGGGASKEQFCFDLESGDGSSERMVLRMDPFEGIVETSRSREAEVLDAIHGIVPVPRIAWVDPDGAYMGQPAMIAHFIGGVTKPTSGGGGPSGLGIKFDRRVGEALTPQYVGNLVAVHALDLATKNLPSLDVPKAGTEAALWQVNFWSRVLADDGIDTYPMLHYTQYWLRQNLPICERPVLLHGDYRLGNFMFDEGSLEMTAILDWELSHIGDYHEDVSYSLEPLFCSKDENGDYLVSSMMSVDRFLSLYTEMSGNVIDPATLHWYRVLNTYKLAVMNLTSGIRAARDGTNHQCAFLSFLSGSGTAIAASLPKLLTGEMQ
jgi:aminoglycoside phosphotransferase (APT) family kinase protein